MSAFFISPHFDDAICSCCGRMLKEQEKMKVNLVTVFSSVKEPFSTYAMNLHKYWKLKNPKTDRYEENIEACNFLKINQINLNFLDAIYRTNNLNQFLYPNDGDIFESISPDDYSLITQIIKEIKNNCSSSDKLFFPASIGNHVDHVITMNCGLILKKEGYNVIFYRDFSYSGRLPIELKKCKKNILKLDDGKLETKVEAVSKYKSQINMLFGNKSLIYNTYKIKFKGDEIYYE